MLELLIISAVKKMFAAPGRLNTITVSMMTE